MQGKRNAANGLDLPVIHRLDGDIAAQPCLQNAFSFCRTQIAAAAPAGMIRVRVSDDGLVYRLPGVDVKVTLAAVQAFRGESKDAVHGLLRSLRDRDNE
jgi:hypothetical protein